ncbi:MAG: NADH:flavin oxidoreductase/NADH oxidase family protein [Planctomycetes bacterium]|nr:NADH:flavin oxidoreductase/NADH oxidase family protein [Planctomycetota bacterium]
MTPQPALAASLTLRCGATLPNRIAKAAMSEQLAAPGHLPDARLVRLYERWGAGGAGLLITGNVMIDPAALGEPGNVVLEAGTDLAPFRAWAEAARGGGAQAWVQLNHPGRQSPRTLSAEPVAPSAVGVKGLGPAFAQPRALDALEVEALVERFAVAAALSERAGFGGIQIHAAHGYLISQFLSPLANVRDDAWGGDPPRRRRFLFEVLRATRAATQPGFAIGVKLNSADFQRGGFSERESLEVVRLLGEEAVDLIEISGGTYERAAMWEGTPQQSSTRAREAYFLEFAERARDVTRAPLMLTGGFRSLEGMQAALASGAVDVIGLARPLAAEPDLPARLLAGEASAALPIRLGLGSRKLNLLVEGSWYQVQLQRMGSGKDPDPRMSSLRALASGLCGAFRRPRRGL